MKATTMIRTMAMIAGLACAAAAQAQNLFTPNFTYQGQLKDGSTPVTGVYEFVFSLYSTEQGGTLIESNGSVASPIAAPVVDGLFTRELQWQAGAFNGQDRWLEIRVRAQGAPGFTTLTPRQKVGATAYSIQTRGIHVDNAGKVGIGTTSPVSLLSLGAPANALLTIDSGSNAAEYSALNFHDRGQAHWGMGKDPFNNFYLDRSGDGRVLTVAADTGYLGLGTTAPTALLHVNGRIKASILEIVGGSDIAEPFDVSGGQVEPGMVVCIDPARLGAMRISSTEYDRTVAGVISGAGGVETGMLLRQENTVADGLHPVALSGRVWVWVDADKGGPITPGDLITTSATPGHGMKASDRDRSAGAVIGKAMSTLESGRGLVLVLVNLH